MNNKKIDLGKNKYIIIVGGIMLIMITFIIVLTHNFSKIMGNSVISYSCADNTYTVEGDYCVKIRKSDALLLGDANNDYKVDTDDLNVLKNYLDSEDYDSENEIYNDHMIAVDINGDNSIDEVDYNILQNYLNNAVGTYSFYYDKIGVNRLCMNDYKLNGQVCEKKEIVDAIKKNNDKIVESVGDNSSKKFTIIFNPNGGTGNMKNMVVNFGTSQKLNKNTYVNAGKKFLGWNVYNETRKKWLCYTGNIKKETAQHQAYMAEDKCNYGKSLYSDGETVSKTTTIDGEKLIFYAVWDSNENKNSVSVKFNSNQNNSTLKYKTLVKIIPEFSISGSRQYYYKWNTYIYDKLHYSSLCQKVPNGKTEFKSLDMTGDRQGGIQIYLDDKCNNKVGSEYKTLKYYCTGCSPVAVDFTKLDKITYKKGEVVHNNIHFKLNDSTRTYYYKWNISQDDKWNTIGSCQAVVSGKIVKDLTINGNTQGRISIYNDSSCKNIINNYDTQLFNCSNCNNSVNNKQFTVKYNANGGSGSMNSQKITYGVSTKLSENKFTKNNYYYIGWRVYNNNKKQWACYKNNSKTSQGYTTDNNCKKYGYVIYKNKQSVSKTANAGETITMYALWQYSYKNIKSSFSGFERNPKGATVWPMAKIDMYKNSNGTSKIGTVPQGIALKVLDMTNMNNSKNSYVKVKYNGKEGYINGWLTMINLSDVIPSALYNITNASSSIFKSRQYTLSGVTGKDIYGSAWKSSMAPIRIETAKKIQAVQTTAKKYGNKIKIYDSFRPWVVQRKVADAVKDSWFTGKGYTITSDFDSSKNTNGAGQIYIGDYKGWFIAIASSTPSSHNIAKAIDVTLVFSDDNQEIPTQSTMHELSGNSIPTKQKVDNNKGELALNYLFTNSGFKFLPSEWWHFEDTQNTNYSGYYSQLKCLGNPYANNKYNCKVNQIELAK